MGACIFSLKLVSYLFQALYVNDYDQEDSFVKFKDRGGSVKPSNSVILICRESEKCFQRLMSTSGGDLPREKGIDLAISIAVLHE